MSGATSPAGDPHPGSIVNEDRIENRTWVELAEHVPAEIAWVQVGASWKPVVRIEISGAGNRRRIASFGPDGELLESTSGTVGPG